VFTGRIPRIKHVLEAMDEKDYQELIEALEDVTIPAPTISKVLARRGINLDPASINKYRRGEFAHVIKK
jgi:aminoglycoside phosphotransferase (APT) family kinase protein